VRSRFLQGPDTDPKTVDAIREAVRNQKELTVRILNYTKSGRPFWNMFTLAPMSGWYQGQVWRPCQVGTRGRSGAHVRLVPGAGLAPSAAPCVRRRRSVPVCKHVRTAAALGCAWHAAECARQHEWPCAASGAVWAYLMLKGLCCAWAMQKWSAQARVSASRATCSVKLHV